MADDDKSCPCEAVKELRVIVGRHDDILTTNRIDAAVVKAEFNTLKKMLAVIGSAIVVICLKLLFPGV